MFFVKSLLGEICGDAVKSLKGLAIIDNQDLFSCIHNLKSCDDKRLLSDIISIRQSIHEDETIAEVRFVPGKEMIADCLTKSSRNSADLMMILRTGLYQIPGGTALRDSTLLSIKTWQELVTEEGNAMKEGGQENSSAEEGDVVGPVLQC